jgi:hypothetical protein
VGEHEAARRDRKIVASHVRIVAHARTAVNNARLAPT